MISSLDIEIEPLLVNYCDEILVADELEVVAVRSINHAKHPSKSLHSILLGEFGFHVRILIEDAEHLAIMENG